MSRNQLSSARNAIDVYLYISKCMYIAGSVDCVGRTEDAARLQDFYVYGESEEISLPTQPPDVKTRSNRAAILKQQRVVGQTRMQIVFCLSPTLCHKA